MTSPRNQAVDSVVGKISQVKGGILVFGNDERLGEEARKQTLRARVKADADVVSASKWRWGQVQCYALHAKAALA